MPMLAKALLLIGLVQAATGLVVGATPTLQRCRFASPAMMAKKVAVKKDMEVRLLPDGPARDGEHAVLA